jgi:hypothetical protein
LLCKHCFIFQIYYDQFCLFLGSADLRNVVGVAAVLPELVVRFHGCFDVLKGSLQAILKLCV